MAQDILPHICIYDECETPNKLYPTSDELLKHMLSNHSIAKWVCDHCSSESGTNQSFIFAGVEDWKSHMKTKHRNAFAPSQLVSLSKISMRKMLEPMACPLCGYVAEHPTTTLDDHITTHLHGFALRCLPWGNGGDDGDSINAKSADALSSTELSDMGEIDPYDVDMIGADSLTRLHQIISILFEAIAGHEWSTDTELQKIGNYLHHIHPHLVESAASILRICQKERQSSHALPLMALFPTSKPNVGSDKVRLTGNLLNYSNTDALRSARTSDKLYEALMPHLIRIIAILHQRTLNWGGDCASNAFHLYCDEIRPSVLLTVEGNNLDIDHELLQRWNKLSTSEQQVYESQLNYDTTRFVTYVSDNTEASKTALEDELNALRVIFSKIEEQQEVTPNSTGLAHQSDEPLGGSELIEVYSHPNANVDIVFVHGLNGHPRRTWQAKNGTFWPFDLLPSSLKPEQARVLMYGYDFNLSAASDLKLVISISISKTSKLITLTYPAAQIHFSERHRRCLAFWHLKGIPRRSETVP